MRLIADVPTVTADGGRVAHIASHPGQIWGLSDQRGQRFYRQAPIEVACHASSMEAGYRGRFVTVDSDKPLCRKCVKAYTKTVSAVILDGEGTFKRGSRSDMGGLDQILARVYDRYRKQDQRGIWPARTTLVGEVLDTIREELT